MQRSAEPAALLAGGSRQLETQGTKSSAGGAVWEEMGDKEGHKNSDTEQTWTLACPFCSSPVTTTVIFKMLFYSHLLSHAHHSLESQNHLGWKTP